LFTIHEEIGISADAALPIAGCTFPIVFLSSLIGYLVKKVVGAAGDVAKVPAMERQPQ
jgi:hypothetical protein